MPAFWSIHLHDFPQIVRDYGFYAIPLSHFWSIMYLYWFAPSGGYEYTSKALKNTDPNRDSVARILRVVAKVSSNSDGWLKLLTIFS